MRLLISTVCPPEHRDALYKHVMDYSDAALLDIGGTKMVILWYPEEMNDGGESVHVRFSTDTPFDRNVILPHVNTWLSKLPSAVKWAISEPLATNIAGFCNRDNLEISFDAPVIGLSECPALDFGGVKMKIEWKRTDSGTYRARVPFYDVAGPVREWLNGTAMKSANLTTRWIYD